MGSPHGNRPPALAGDLPDAQPIRVHVGVQVVASGDGFVLKLGPICFWLERREAENLTCLLADALESGEPADPEPPSSN